MICRCGHRFDEHCKGMTDCWAQVGGRICRCRRFLKKETFASALEDLRAACLEFRAACWNARWPLLTWILLAWSAILAWALLR